MDVATGNLLVNAALLVVAAVGVVQGLRTLGELQRNGRVQAYQTAYESLLQVDRLLVERPHLRAYIYGRAKVPQGMDPRARAEIEGMAEMVLHLFGEVVGCREAFPEEKRHAWDNYMRQTFASSPAMRGFLKGHRDWYSPELKAAVGFETPLAEKPQGP